MVFSTIFNTISVISWLFYWLKKSEYPKKTTDLPQLAITGDLKVMTNHTSLRDMLAKRSKYCEPNSINWKQVTAYNVATEP